MNIFILINKIYQGEQNDKVSIHTYFNSLT